jgi:PleD family two-component response regulator
MDTSAQTDSTILIATDSAIDAEMVRSLLGREFEHVFLSTDPDHAVSDFDEQQPDVLVLAFNELEKSERYSLGLYRLSQVVHHHPHRTVILCSKEEVKRVYDLCMKDYFDDYVLFWPMTFDASRLLMSVHYALRELSALKAAPSAAEFAAEARRLAGLENTLDQQLVQGTQHIETANLAMEQAEQNIGTALDGFSQRLIAQAQPNPAAIKNLDALKNEIKRFKQEEVHQHFHAAAESAKPVKQWAQEIKQECGPYLESARVLKALAERIRPIVLVVDDDEFQCKIIGKILETENYHLVFASNGFEALNILRKTRPDVILMDVMMPGIDGMETTRRLKAVPQSVKAPVIMITGKSEGKIVVDCLKAGAVDFVVKPFDSATLIAKIARAFNATTASP